MPKNLVLPDDSFDKKIHGVTASNRKTVDRLNLSDNKTNKQTNKKESFII
jgi:hypothetical protein